MVEGDTTNGTSTTNEATQDRIKQRLLSIVTPFDSDKSTSSPMLSDTFERCFTIQGLTLREIVLRLFPATSLLSIDLLFTHCLLLSVLCLVACLAKEIDQQKETEKGEDGGVSSCFPLPKGSPDYMVRYHAGKFVIDY